MAQSGISLLLFLDPALREEGQQLVATYPNVRIPEYLPATHPPQPVELPSHRNESKDSAEYLWIQCRKLEILERALEHTDRPYLAWIDFRIFHIFPETRACQERLVAIENHPWEHSKILAPGCWPSGNYDPWSRILWRFCGGFLLAPRDCVKEAAARQAELVFGNMPELTWEVNYWTQMEDHFQWYKGDHNASILPPVPRERSHPTH